MEGKFRGKGLITKCVSGESYLEQTVTTQTVVSKGFVCRQNETAKVYKSLRVNYVNREVTAHGCGRSAKSCRPNKKARINIP